MTEKQIIIDGVDVSGCMFYRMTNMGNFYCRSNQKDFSEFCEKNSNCYYKHLQRLKSENAEIKAKLATAETAYQIALINKENRHKKEIENLKRKIGE